MEGLNLVGVHVGRCGVSVVARVKPAAGGEVEGQMTAQRGVDVKCTAIGERIAVLGDLVSGRAVGIDVPIHRDRQDARARTRTVGAKAIGNRPVCALGDDVARQ